MPLAGACGRGFGCPQWGMIEAFMEPGVLVRHPERPDWGIGQVQSVDGRRVTITFEEVGKQVIDISHVELDYVGPDPRADGRGA